MEIGVNNFFALFIYVKLPPILSRTYGDRYQEILYNIIFFRIINLPPGKTKDENQDSPFLYTLMGVYLSFDINPSLF